MCSLVEMKYNYNSVVSGAGGWRVAADAFSSHSETDSFFFEVLTSMTI